MFSKLFRSRRHRVEPATPPDVRIYAVGDIHGRADLHSDLLDQIVADATRYPDRQKTIIYVGDYVDRGLQSKQVIDQLISGGPSGFQTVHLKGNHEAMMLDFLSDPRVGTGWLELGGAATLYSYGVGIDSAKPGIERFEEARVGLSEKLPPAHLEFLRRLDLRYVAGDYLFVHAGIRPGVPLDDQTEDDILWIRSEFLESTADHGKVIVHGHSITWKPEITENRIGIDTGAFASGMLTCAVLDGEDKRFLHAKR